MRDLSKPLAPSIFKGEGKKRRQARKRMRQEDRRDRKKKLPSVEAQNEAILSSEKLKIIKKEGVYKWIKKTPESVNEVSNKRRKKSSVPKPKYRRIGGGKTTPNRRMR